MYEQVLDKIIEAIVDLFGKDPATLSAETKFVDDLAFKSVSYVHVIAALEDEYDVQIPFMQFRRNKTLGEAAAFVSDIVDE